MIFRPAPTRAERHRLARLRRADRRADYVLHEAEPIDPAAVIEADNRAAIRFGYALLVAFFAAIVAAIIAA